MPALDESFAAIEAALAERYGRPPAIAEGRDPFEAVVAVVLDRALEARKLAPALDALRDAGLLDPRAMAEADATELVATLRDAGVSAPARALGPLLRLARWVVDRFEGDPDALTDETASTSSLRDDLAQIHGVGPATADAILLHALGRASYPVDRASYRILVRHGWLDPTAEYDEARSVVERQAPDDPDRLARLSSWFERIGRDACRASVAKCDRCPLRPFLPEGGPLGDEG
jgi:endonuclease III related protein